MVVEGGGGSEESLRLRGELCRPSPAQCRTRLQTQHEECNTLTRAMQEGRLSRATGGCRRGGRTSDAVRTIWRSRRQNTRQRAPQPIRTFTTYTRSIKPQIGETT
ncbi:hypothetical protein SLA2020_437670 [Shorea laevis]